MGHDASSIESEIDRLYQLPLKAFTQERNALIARLREAGAAEAADRVKSLAKPPVSAWAVNQVYWTARRDFDELIDASDRLRALQARGVTPNELRDVMRERGLGPARTRPSPSAWRRRSRRWRHTAAAGQVRSCLGASPPTSIPPASRPGPGAARRRERRGARA